MQLVPLKVKIGLKNENGHTVHAFPSFNDIAPNLRDNLDWSYFIDQFGGWHYDKIIGHMEQDAESPTGIWLGMILVPNSFAQEAIKLFPESCQILTELEAEKFYNERAHIREPEVFEDAEVLQAIVAKQRLGIPQNQDDINALNPDHPQIGRRRNPNKTWNQYKINRVITIEKNQ